MQQGEVTCMEALTNISIKKSHKALATTLD
jgi:hypothetical protein